MSGSNTDLTLAGVTLTLVAAVTLLCHRRKKPEQPTKKESKEALSVKPINPLGTTPISSPTATTAKSAVVSIDPTPVSISQPQLGPTLEIKKPPRDPRHSHFFHNPNTSDTQTSQIANDGGYYLHDEKDEGEPEHTQYLSSIASSFHQRSHDSNEDSSSPEVEKIPSFSRSPSFFEPNDTGIAAYPENEFPEGSPTWTALGIEQPMVIAMVGLPARGKSYLVKMIMRYLKWIGFDCRMFNVGSYRRQVGLGSAEASFFDPSNAKSSNIREELAMAVQNAMYVWLHEMHEDKRRVAIFDATNTTKDRRLALIRRARQESVFLLFVESICDDEKVLLKNYELKLNNDDYKNMDQEVARKDFISRVHAYEKVYQTIEDQEDDGNLAYIKVINVGTKIITRNCHGFLPSQVAFYLQNVHIQPRKIYLTLVSESIESQYGVNRLAGGESGELTLAGLEYGQNLASFLSYEQQCHLQEDGKDIVVLTGTANIHFQSVQALKKRSLRVFHTPLLNELRGGDLHGLSKQSIKERYPVEYDKRLLDKLTYRYPGIGGESYLDVIERIRPVLIELERQRKSVVIVGHIAVLRCIYAYFMGIQLNEIPYKEFKYHRVYELNPGPFGCSCAIIQPYNNSDHPYLPPHMRTPTSAKESSSYNNNNNSNNSNSNNSNSNNSYHQFSMHSNSTNGGGSGNGSGKGGGIQGSNPYAGISNGYISSGYSSTCTSTPSSNKY